MNNPSLHIGLTVCTVLMPQFFSVFTVNAQTFPFVIFLFWCHHRSPAFAAGRVRARQKSLTLSSM